MEPSRHGRQELKPDRARPHWAWLCAIVCIPQIACIHGPRPLMDDAAPVPQAAHPGHTHVVQSGETLYRIAQHEGVSAEALAAENGIDDPATLEVGRRSSSPEAAAPGAASIVPLPSSSGASRSRGATRAATRACSGPCAA